MRVRIIRKPPSLYGNGVDSNSLLVGRVYNLAPAVASALMIDGYAELYDALSPSEKRARAGQAAHMAWTAADRPPRWTVPIRKKKR